MRGIRVCNFLVLHAFPAVFCKTVCHALLNEIYSNCYRHEACNYTFDNAAFDSGKRTILRAWQLWPRP